MIILFDGPYHDRFLPLTYTRPVADLLTGIGSIRKKWELITGQEVGVFTREYLQNIYPTPLEGEHIWISATVIPNPNLWQFISEVKSPTALIYKEEHIAYIGYPSRELTLMDGFVSIPKNNTITVPENISFIQLSHLWDLFRLNHDILVHDFNYFTTGKTSATIPNDSQIIGEQIFIEAGAKISAAIINTTTGPVYLTRNSEVMEGALIRGGLFLGENSMIKMGAKLYGAISIGDHCKIGGEVNNTIVHDYSNKGHEGYLGNSVVGSWCNFGADTNASNLKNTYEHIKYHSISEKKLIDSGLQFLGLMMGDHSKTSINTMLNTGTVIGVSANIYGEGFPPKYIPSFFWGGSKERNEYRIDKALSTARRVMERKNIILNSETEDLFKYLFQLTQSDRNT